MSDDPPAASVTFKKRGKRSREHMKTTSALAQQNGGAVAVEEEKPVVVKDVTENEDDENEEEPTHIPPPSADDDERESSELTGSLAELKKKLQKKRKVNEDLISTTKSRTIISDHSVQSTRSAAPDTKNYASNVTVTIEARDNSKLKEGQPKWAGPLKQANNVRAISRFDYQPDICKDYKETGYCGYGDNCKFMHDRGDYKSGWQLEQEWDAKQEAKKRALLSGTELEEENYEIREDSDLPWACLICREPFTNPVVTKCGHYFCETCALSHYQKDTKCQECGQQTSGIFNTANNIIADQKRRKAKEAEEAENPKIELEPTRPREQEGWAIPG